jgi:hypothetical protein
MAHATAAAGPAREVDLYAPVKALLESQGYVVKGEVRGCDVVGLRGDELPVIVELKRTFGLDVVLQGLDRLAMTDAVYIAVGAWPRDLEGVGRLCRRVGLGLIVVGGDRADVVVDPLPYRPRRDRGRTARLLGEHQRRVGDPTQGGSVRRPIMTAYRQRSLRCLTALADGPMTLPTLRTVSGVSDAGAIVQRDLHGWFERVARGTYAISPRGRAELAAMDPRG